MIWCYNDYTCKLNNMSIYSFAIPNCKKIQDSTKNIISIYEKTIKVT